ncbi:MAG: hypothetical protein IT467_08600 [Dokdonella sp.]|uniref:hypothetical protein n=1 Tax=Dokdonella sp. TaxID=2291710 RepID=UPI0025B9D240|nr:hypothetical protein [Dokdonella sp.]MBZ0224108.1 hypothetical protein [Dokdonella sp.]MCC7255975.1 hypothetical protein [Dokdonella sp.]
MFKKSILALALVATAAFAQENADISGANFQSGSADGTLSKLGREAAASGARLIITAPHEWHAKIAAKVRAGGKADIVMRDGFYENVLVRIEDKNAAKAAAEPTAAERARVEAQRSRAEVEKAKAEAEAAKAEAETAKAEAEAAKAAAEKASAEADAAKAQAEADAAKVRLEAERVAAEKERLEREREAAAAAAATPATKGGSKNGVKATSKPAAEPVVLTGEAAVRERMEKSLNDGRPATGNLVVSKLRSGDTLYVDEGVIAVIRRDAGKPLLFWLEGELDLRRSELKETAPNRYQVLGLIQGEGSLRREFATEQRVEAKLPAATSTARKALEKSVNDGNAISESLATKDLRNGDVLNVDGDAIAVSRRDGIIFTRYWLVGTIDLNQMGILREAPNRFRIIRDSLR